MGHRAQYCIIREGSQRWYHSHWGGLYIPETICSGPETAARDIQAETEIDTGNGAFDDIWCEGGCVLDWDARRLLFFGGEDITCSRRWRETFMRLIQPLWEGWTLHWAHRGPSELAEYAGNDPQTTPGRRERDHGPHGCESPCGTTLGSIPLLGGIFDVYWKSHLRNVELLQRHFDASIATRGPTERHMVPRRPDRRAAADAGRRADDHVFRRQVDRTSGRVTLSLRGSPLMKVRRPVAAATRGSMSN